MNDKIYDYLIVGSGAGGATLAKELAQRKKDVLVVETGKIEEKVGEFNIARKFYDGDHLLRISGKSGKREILAKKVILSAGGIGTPIILQNSGIEGAGTNLFVDLFLNVYGTTEDERLNQVFEPGMTLVSMDFHKSKGFLISPYVNHSYSAKFLEFGLKGFVMSDKKTLGLMVKTTDDPIGYVYPNGLISKPVTENDRKRLKEGVDVAKGILQKAGAKSIKISRLQGGHPGGTAAIGKVVDKNLQTKIDGLFLCDASVLPVSPGLPPILTIVALAKKLAKSI